MLIELCLLFIILLLLYKYDKNIGLKYKRKCFNIAHGCGRIDNIVYTNSLETLYKSYRNGYRYIEIDLQVIEGNHIIGAHDMKRFKYLTNFSLNDKINYDYIKSKKILYKYNIIYDYMIHHLLNKYKDLSIFTDKITNYKLLKKYSKQLDRIYVEVFNYNQFKESSKLGFKNILLNINSYIDLKNLVNNKNNTIKAITIGPNIFNFYKSELLLLFNRNISIFVFLVNNVTAMKLSFCKYVNGFYID